MSASGGSGDGRYQPMLAVDLGGTHMRLALFDAGGAIAHRRVVDTPKDDPGALPRAMQEALAGTGLPIAGAVVGVPGVVDDLAGEPLRLPNLPQWEGHLSERALSEATGLPVLLANDADLAALGEHRFGAGQGTADMLYLTVSTGIGGGVIVGGRLLRARRSLAEVGHMIIERGSGKTAEDLGSGTALEQASGMSGAEVTERALAGDERALAFFRDAADAFAVALVNAVLCFMPERVVIGGGVSNAGDLLLEVVRERLASSEAARFIEPEQIAIAATGDDPGLLGAFAFWQDERAGSA